MALGFATEAKASGDILPIVKWDAKSGAMVRVDRYQDAGGAWTRDENDMEIPVKFVADFDNIEVGWLSFAGGAPDFHMVRIGGEMPARPSPDHKNAFRLRIYNKDLGLREFSHSAKTVLRKMDELHSQFEAERGANEGKVPVIAITSIEKISITTPDGSKSTYRVPSWKIASWVDRPEAMDGGSSPAPAPKPLVQEAAEEDDLF